MTLAIPQGEAHPDPVDAGTDAAQNERDLAVSLIQSKIVPTPTSEECLHCGEATKGGARWCNSKCRDDWQAWNPEA